MAGGWYLLVAEGVPVDAEPWLAGEDEAGIEVRVPLPPASTGRVERVVLLARRTGDLHLRDGAIPLQAGFTLHPIDRDTARRRMFDGLRHADGRRDLGLIIRVVANAGARFLSGDRTGAGDVLVAAYASRHSRGTDISVRTGVLWPRRARLSPIEQLRIASRSEAGGGEWETLGDDPKMLLSADGRALPLPAGWYLFDARLQRRAGQLVGPAFYPEYPGAPHPDDVIELPAPGFDGRLDVLVLLKAPVQRLRFDPTRRQARFVLEGARLRRIGRLRALARMLPVTSADGGIDWRATLRNASEFIGHALREGVSTAAVAAFARHRRSRADAVRSYGGWVRRYDTIGPAESTMFRHRSDRLRTMPGAPRFSILLPTYETPERWLRECLDSVMAQAWPVWELCVADDASPSPHVRRIVESYARRDPRVRLTVRPRNGHIAAASNTALEMATGDFVVLLDHDDLLRPHALLEMAEAIVAAPGIAMLYSDEDKVDEHGRRFDPYFKPDWNPDLVLGQNYVCHLTAIRTELVRRVGGFREGFDGSQDHDLVLRCSRDLAPARIHHVPRVLYHWRAIPGSTALERGAKDYAGAAGARAVQDHVHHEHSQARVEQLGHGHYRVHWPLPGPAPRVSLIVPTRDRPELLRTCVESLLSRTDYPDMELLLVDNGSRDPEALALLGEFARQPRVRVLRDDRPFNYSALNNLAAREATGDVLALVNNDIEVIEPGWLREMVSQALRPGVGAVGAMLLYPDRRIQHGGVVLGLGGIANHAWVGEPETVGGHGGRARVAQTLSAVTGACLVVRRDLYLGAGGLDERLQVAFNDIDFCLRLGQAGHRCVWTPFARLVHHESASRGSDADGEKRERFLGEIALMQARWGDRLERDPAYNPNLSLTGAGFEPADPPRA